MKQSVQLLAVSALMFQTGCVIFPHGGLVAPPASGQVMDSASLRPLAHAKVERHIQMVDRSRVVTTDPQGRFTLKKDTDLRWIPFVCYAASSIQYRITTEGYHPFTTNLLGGGSFYRGRQPHELGQVLLRKTHE